MPLSWDDSKRLARLHGVAEELLTTARTSAEQDVIDDVERQLGRVGEEIESLLSEVEPAMADEFSRIVLQDSGNPLRPEVRAASMAGWLHAAIVMESVEQKAREEMRSMLAVQEKRKHTYGFKARKPATREADES